MKYIKKFKTNTNYDVFKAGSEYITPNIVYIKENDSISFTEYAPPKAKAGDIAYWDGSEVKTIRLSDWKTSLGTPVGVVVIPEGFTSDGKVRIVSLRPVDSNGNPSNTHNSVPWCGNSTDTALKNYERVPTTDNYGSSSTGSNGNGYLPSDRFKGAQSFVDILSKYYGSNNLIPSPYLLDEPNPDYYRVISEYGNVLSDLNGLANTQTLISRNSDYTAAYAASKYSDGVSNLQWFLPAMGELGYLIPRFKTINLSISAVNGIIIPDDSQFWSSSENNSLNTWCIGTNNGFVTYGRKGDSRHFRPFATLD